MAGIEQGPFASLDAALAAIEKHTRGVCRHHRIGLEISSSNFPHYDRNPNTGTEFGQETSFKVADQTILHDANHPFRIILPIIPMPVQ
jgi:predicted acyl esterase